ncbi:MAG: hypothetical protein UW70_C0005G0013 [Candidatus Peregrinibacteria bacterium GW2011_GWA2_44_7]|nr:MAG: hypothetical protein UW70_C0005G0013 [Candidatus Peregrinibacteria bacterium GW2011_GWA2_44_7]
MNNNKFLIVALPIIGFLFSLITITNIEAATAAYDCNQNVCIYVDQMVPTSFTEGIFMQADIVKDTFSDGSQAYPFITVQSALDYIKSYPDAKNHSFVLLTTGTCAPSQNLINDWWKCSFAVDSSFPKTVLTAVPGETTLPQMELKSYLSVVTLNNASDFTMDGLKFTWTDTEATALYSNFNVTGTTKNVKIINNTFEVNVPEYGAVLTFSKNIEDLSFDESTIENNTFSGRFASAIYVVNNGMTGAIKNNKFINPNSLLLDLDVTSHGVSVLQNSTVNGNIEGNSFEMTGKGIYGNNAKIKGSILNNTITVIASGIQFVIPSDYINNPTLNLIEGDIANNQINVATSKSAQSINTIGSGISVEYTDLKSFSVKNNTIYNQALRPFTDAAKTITIANNDILNFHYGCSLSAINPTVEFYNNVITTNNLALALNRLNKISLKNNSIYQEKTDIISRRSLILISNSPNTFIYNSILYADIAAIEIYDNSSELATKLISDNNLFYNKNKNIQFILQNVTKTLAEWQSLGYDKASFVVNPLYVNTLKQPLDLHLRSLSPAIDKGNNSYAPPTTTDKDGKPRIATGKTRKNIDIGAYEYQS